MDSCTNLLTKRQYGDYTDTLIKNKLMAARQFIDRLELEAELVGHNGCVNCLEFSENGRILASASDDYRVLLWDPFRHKKPPLLEIQTPHRGNIFSVKFLPKCNNSLIATGAADSHIFVFDVNRHETPIFKCFCHFHRVKRLAVAPDMPDLFWSSAEDGQVLQFDIREPHQCRSDNPVVLLDLNNHSDSYVETKCIAVNPRKTYLMAVGANDVYARIYDRRMIVLNKVRSVENNRNFSHQTQNQDYKDNLVKGCCQYYAPGHLQNSDHFNKTITYIAFSPNGNEILANYGAEQIYLFDLNNAESPILLNLPKFPEIPTQRPQLNGEISKIKKVGNDHLETENYLSAIKAYSKGILLDPSCSILYHNRATALMRRKWNGDVYDALKDCHVALKLDPYYYKAHFRLARALLELNQLTLANEALMEFKKRFPAHDNDAVLELEHDINSALRNRGSSTSNREVTSELSDNEIFWRSNAKDFKDRFIGHCNTKTDIKEANFFGPDGTFIVAGSDDGHFYVWERQLNSVVRAFRADEAIVNCVQPHPFACLLATSGIDHEIRLWTPQPEDKAQENLVKHVDPLISKNQKHMQNDLFEFDTEGTAMCRTS